MTPFATSSTTTVVTTPAILSLPPKKKNLINGYNNKHGKKNNTKVPPKKISFTISTIPDIRHKKLKINIKEVLILLIFLLPLIVSTIS